MGVLSVNGLGGNMTPRILSFVVLAHCAGSVLLVLPCFEKAGSMQDTGVTLSESLSINLSFNLIPIDLPDDPLTLRHRLLANEVGLPLL
ncbi:hypothetical protein TWF751_005950 [Orbilia oligospora]|nr:hypothetical protein TWF751_005950 [Orbilia oligospora]